MMNAKTFPFSKNSRFSTAIAGLLLLGSALAQAAEQTQTLTLAAGWNAVWLETSPLDSDGEAATIEDVFSDTAITFVGRPITPVGTAEFISDPSITYNQDGWALWNRDSVSGNSLTRIRGNQAYLIFNSGLTAISQDVTGTVDFHEPSWVPGNYNLVGFGLTGSPTFSEFFGSAGDDDGIHPISKLFTLDAITGHWQSVVAGGTMESGKAYWIFSTRNSTFAGPVAIEFDGFSGLSFGTGPGSLNLADSGGSIVNLTPGDLTFSNVDESSHSVTLSLIDSSDELRLYQVVPEPDVLAFTLATGSPVTDWTITSALAADTAITVTVGANRNWTSGGNSRENLYRIEIGIGSSGATQYFWLPATASRTDAGDEELGPQDSAYTGLWVGQVMLDTVTSIAESGNPEVATTSVLPMQVIIHVDDSGVPSLLSHVLFMQTKTADESVIPTPVLVIDEAKIPFFEGIELKNGRRVGRRIETAAYDMPRLDDATSQAAIRDDALTAPVSFDLGIEESDVTATQIDSFVADQAAAALGIDVADLTTAQLAAYESDPDNELAGYIADYVSSSATRPPDLVEIYRLSLPLEGGLSPNSIVQTSSDQMVVLDPFHRSNPFRHAFHPRHGTGIEVSRAITITFDDTDTDGLLTGSYIDSFYNLTNLATPLVASGSITLRRISDIGDLQ